MKVENKHSLDMHKIGKVYKILNFNLLQNMNQIRLQANLKYLQLLLYKCLKQPKT